MIIAPRKIGPPTERNIDVLPRALAPAVKKRLVAGRFVRMNEFAPHSQTYAPAVYDSAQFLLQNHPSEKVANVYCHNGAEFSKCFKLFASSVTALYPGDKAFADELESYREFFASKFERLPAQLAAQLEEAARIWVMEQHIAFWPLAPELLHSLLCTELDGVAIMRARPPASSSSSSPAPAGRSRAALPSPGRIPRKAPAAIGVGPPVLCRNFHLANGKSCFPAGSPCVRVHECPCGKSTPPLYHSLASCPHKATSERLQLIFHELSAAAQAPKKR